MTTEPSRDRRVKLFLIALALVALGYAAVRIGVRAVVDREIEKHVGNVIPDFDLPMLDGTRVKRSDFAGKILILHFSRSKCGSCEIEKPEIRKFEQTLDPARVALLTINTDRVMGFAEDVSQKTVERSAFRHPTVFADREFLESFHGATWANVTPITYFVDTQLRTVKSLRGAQTADALTEALVSLN